MQGSALQAHNGNAGIFDELFNTKFTVVVLLILERRKGTDAQDVKIIAHDRGGILHMFDGISAHNGLLFKFKGPAFFIDVKDNGFRTQVLRRDLGRKTGCAYWD